MANPVRILFTQNTVIKQEPIQSSQLPSYLKQDIPVGTLLVLQSYGIEGDHIRFSLKELEFKGYRSSWYAYEPHIAIIKEPLRYVKTVSETVPGPYESNSITLTVSWSNIWYQQGLVKLVSNRDTVIKQKPIDSRWLDESYKQVIPAGTELVLLTNKPDSYNRVTLPIEDWHVKCALKDIEFKGFGWNWYAYIEHVGILPVS
ncbi:MAG: hypothetical protein F6K47_14410 [Symploca sp. SIO2E6]|nr:hypothetical protein [Symploca sp. SIO2E6]